MAAPTIIDPFFRALYQKIAEEIDNRASTLVSGGALIHGNIGIDATATAIKYQAAVSYIEALQMVVDLGLSMDKERYRSNKNEDGD